MSVRISISGATTADSITRLFDRIPERAERSVRAVVRATALRVEGSAKDSIQRGPKSGRVYRTHNKRRPHQASAPGQAPATDTGTLVSRIFHEVEAGGMQASVASDVDYAAYLELGTRHMAPRPYLAPALRRHEYDFLRDLDLAVSGALHVP